MKRIITISIFILLHLSLIGQEEGVDYSNREQAIFTSFVTSYISLYNSSIDIGYEKRFFDKYYVESSHFAIEGKAGIIIPFDGWVNENKPESQRSNQQGWILSITPKWIIPNPVNTYMVGLGLNFTQHQYEATRYRDETLSETVSYQVNSKVIGANVIAGFREDIYHHKMLLEFSTGVGIKYHMIENNAPIPVQELEPQSPLIGYLEPEANGNHWRIAIPLNLKFGIRF